jgi:hypothetical protein
MDREGISGSTCSLWKANRSWNVPLTSFLNHLNGKPKTQKNQTNRCFNRRENCSHNMNISYAKLWPNI